MIRLYHKVTGTTRTAPWISLRTTYGRIYFANLLTYETRWFPPKLWMESWVSRTSRFHRASSLGRWCLPSSIARLSVDGGCPYLDSTGFPQYDSDSFDSPRSYPMYPPGLGLS